jgi:hypothetical protein
MIKKILLTLSSLYVVVIFFLVSRGISDGDMYFHDMIYLIGPVVLAWVIYFIWKKPNVKKK